MRFLAVLSALSLIFFFGCVAVSEHVTWGEVDKQAVAYAQEKADISPDNFFYQIGPFKWTCLAHVRELDKSVRYAHKRYQQSLVQLMEKDQTQYSHITNTVETALNDAETREEALFKPGGILSTIMVAGGFSTLTGALTLLRKKGKDYTKEDIAAAKQAAIGEGLITEQGFTQMVQGVQLLKDVLPGEYRSKVNEVLAKVQTTETKKKVAEVKSM